MRWGLRMILMRRRMRFRGLGSQGREKWGESVSELGGS